MKKTLTALALASCVATPLFAQTKEDTITFALTGQKQVSVSTSPSQNNAGLWTQGPRYYKTGSAKFTQRDILNMIGFTRYGNAGFFSSKAKLVLVQGELSGFFNITPELAAAIPLAPTSEGAKQDGNFDVQNPDSSTAIGNSLNSGFVTLANGHHLLTQPLGETTLYPVGHLQPWGQIYVKDPARPGFSAANPFCENVTYFFALAVEECYDCLYMNSFISDATFTIKAGSQVGPPCCTSASTMVGKGKDRYYLSLSFDDTINNPYLNPESTAYVGVPGLRSATIRGDGVVPDQINNDENYNPTIAARVGKFEPYIGRFTLNGILTYTWNLKFFNTSDIAPDFVGTANYAANGYGFVGLYCQLFTGTVTFAEKLVNTACCTDEPWYDNSFGFEGWYGVGAEYPATPHASPMNVGASLTHHRNFNPTYSYMWENGQGPTGWPTPALLYGPAWGSEE